MNYKDKIISEGYDLLQIKEVKTQPLKPIEPQYDYKWIFNLVIIIVAVVMGIVMILKLKKN